MYRNAQKRKEDVEKLNASLGEVAPQVGGVLQGGFGQAPAAPGIVYAQTVGAPVPTAAPAPMIGGGGSARVAAGKGKDYEKKRWSVWMITINSQKDASKMTPEDVEKFKQFITGSILDKDNIFTYLTDSKAPDDPRRNILSILQDGAFEVGAQVGRLHFHGIVRVEHVGLLRFEANKYREAAKKALGYQIYLSSPVSSDPVAAYAQYMRKNVDLAAAEQ